MGVLRNVLSIPLAVVGVALMASLGNTIPVEAATPPGRRTGEQ